MRGIGRSSPPAGRDRAVLRAGGRRCPEGRSRCPQGRSRPVPTGAMEDVLPSGLLEICLLVGAPRERVRALVQVSAVRAGGASALGWVCQRMELKYPNRKFF